MINFRFHLVSLVAVFLALAIGVIMGTAVIDNAVVDRLQAQQRALDHRVNVVQGENKDLRHQLDDAQLVGERLGKEGVARLKDVPVVVVGVRGADTHGLDQLRGLVGAAGARLVTTVWLTNRWALKDDKAVADLRAAIASTVTSPLQLRGEGLQALATALRWSPVEQTADGRVVIDALRQAGFVEIEAPQGQPDGVPRPEQGTRFVLLSGSGADVADRLLALPMARALVAILADRAPAPLVVVEPALPAKAEDDELVVPLRVDALASGQLSTVDDLAEESGQVAALLAIADLGNSRVGHYGRGSHAQALLPPPGTS